MKEIRKERIHHKRLLVSIGIFILVVVGILTSVIMTLTIIPDQPGISGTLYPYTTTFRVSLPEGETVKVGNLDILALRTGDTIALRIGDRREEMDLREMREVADRTVTVKTLGKTAFQTGYRLSVTWTGMEGRSAIFRVMLMSNRQIPDWLVSRVMPAEIQATPS
ncbi:MAG: hypothetical protein CVV33_09560 [Methanomicrobiales archaeon HGW-Methanomicrobiales-4]|nr:MAG: hypothetical protein CVV33_09560 [Methanomicrobiales archaeon HGW-Methanomicrobiales-4]